MNYELRITKGLHVLGSIMVFFGILIIDDTTMDQGALLMIMLVYFAVDSIFFHITIHRRYKVNTSAQQRLGIIDDSNF